MGESMERINKKIEALPHEAPLSNYKVQAYIAEYAFVHRQKNGASDEYDSLPFNGNTVMKWWMDNAYHDKYRSYLDDTPNATIDPHKEEDLNAIMDAIRSHVHAEPDQTLH